MSLADCLFYKADILKYFMRTVFARKLASWRIRRCCQPVTAMVMRIDMKTMLGQIFGKFLIPGRMFSQPVINLYNTQNR